MIYDIYHGGEKTQINGLILCVFPLKGWFKRGIRVHIKDQSGNHLEFECDEISPSIEGLLR